MSRKKIVTTIIAIAISVFFLYIAFKQIDLAELWATLKRVRWIWAIPAAVLTWVSFWWRAWRWRILLRPTQECTINSLLGPMFIGFGFNNIFPARAGEFARPLALKKKLEIPFTTGLSTVVLERLFDVFALLAMFIVVLLFIEFEPGFAFKYGEIQITRELLNSIAKKTTIAAIILFIGAIAVLTPHFRELTLRIVHRLPLLPVGLKEKIAGMIETFASGFRSLHSPMLIFQVAVHTVMVWLLTAMSIWALAFGFAEIEMSFFNALVFLAITCIVIALPAAPGYWGLYEVGGQIALVLAGIVANDQIGLAQAMSFTLAIHFIHWTITTGLGLYYSARIHLSPKDLSRGTEQPS